jgi:hypothetical protein
MIDRLFKYDDHDAIIFHLLIPLIGLIFAEEFLPGQVIIDDATSSISASWSVI